MKRLIFTIAAILTLATVSYACGNEGKKACCKKSEAKACCKKDGATAKACAGGAANGMAEAPKSCSKAKACCKNKATASAEPVMTPVQETPAAH